MTIAIALTLRGVEAGKPVSIRWLIAGSLASAAAVLIRQQGVLFHSGSPSLFPLRGDLRVSWPGLRRLLAIGLIPAIAFFGYLACFACSTASPMSNKSWRHTKSRMQASRDREADRLARPLRADVCRFVRTAHHRSPSWHSHTGARLAGNARLWMGDRRYVDPVSIGRDLHLCRYAPAHAVIPQFLGSGGLGPPDVRGGRTAAFRTANIQYPDQRDHLDDFACTLGGSGAVDAIWSSFRDGDRPGDRCAGESVVGVVLPSYHYIDRGYSLDRYLLPMLPLILASAAWALTDVTFPSRRGGSP